LDTHPDALHLSVSCLSQLLELLKKLTLTGFTLVIVPQDVAFLRLVAAQAVSLAYLALVLLARPYKSSTTAAVAVGTNVALVCIFFTAMLLQIANQTTPSQRLTFFGIESVSTLITLLLVFNFGALASLLLLIGGMGWMQRRRARILSAQMQKVNQANKARVARLLKMEGAPVHIISTPFVSPEGAAKAEEVKAKYDSPPTSYCYNPNTDCDSNGEAGWLKTWHEIAQTTKRTGGKVIVVCRSDETGGRYGNGRFDG
jgi:hypothetical protein